MWVVRLSIVDWVYSKTQTLLETMQTLNQPRENSYVSSEVEHFPTSKMRKKQTLVCHSSTDSEVISQDAGLRLKGIPALDLVLHSSETIQQASRNRCREEGSVVKCREIDRAMKPYAPTPTPNRRDTATEKLMSYLMWITTSQAQNLLTSKPTCTFLKTMRQ